MLTAEPCGRGSKQGKKHDISSDLVCLAACNCGYERSEGACSFELDNGLLR